MASSRRGGSKSAVNKSGSAYKNRGSSTSYMPHQDLNAGNGTYNNSGAWTDNEMLSTADRDKITGIRNQLKAGSISGDEANNQANAIRAGYGYSIDKNGYVTDNGALAAVNNRREKAGMTKIPEGGSGAYYRYLMGTDTSKAAQDAGLVQSYEDFAKENGYTTPTGGGTGSGGSAADYSEILKNLTGQGSGGQPGQSYGSGAPTFDYSYSDKMQDLIDQILNSSLTDWKQGDQYAALRDQYAANGQMSMNDLLGQVSSRTGGLASSYAASVANQEYNDWMSKLEQAAQDMYQQERSDRINDLGILSDAYNREYGAYQDALSQWNTDRAFDYQREQDALSDAWRQKEWDYSLSQDDWSKALQQADTLAQYGDFSGYKALGYTDAQISQMQKAWQIQQALAQQKSSGTTRKASGGSDGDDKEQDYEGLFRAAYNSGDNAKSFIANNYKKYGFTSSSGLYDEYQKAEETPVGSGLEMNEANFTATMRSLAAQLGSGQKNAASTAVGNIDSFWEKLSAAQQQQVQSLLERYGYHYNP